MGKSKKTRWRTFEIGSQDGIQKSSDEVKDPLTASPKNSQIANDQVNDFGTRTFSTHSSYKQRHNNKENVYSQRHGYRSSMQRNWQRNYHRDPTKSLEIELKAEENNGSEFKNTAEPIKFNEDEYTRITTPRQDVLFKKGVYSTKGMAAKTSASLSAESIAASSNLTSDPESSTLSPSTTPLVEFTQIDPFDCGAPMAQYYGYYDENGILVIPMYNGYNYYYPNGSSSTSPMFLMPYPCQYDSFFTDMNPNGLDNEKMKQDLMPQDSTQDFEKEAGTENLSDCDQSKRNFPMHQNGLYSYYYFDGASSERVPKIRRRKRFVNVRNSQHPQSADTTSDDDNISFATRFSPHQGWPINSWFNSSTDSSQNLQINQESNELHLNVDVKPFYPRKKCENLNSEEEKSTKQQKPAENKQSVNRSSKKEITEGIKSMEKQNIDLKASKSCQSTRETDEWNVIKKGKQVKLAKSYQTETLNEFKDEAEKIVLHEVLKVECITPSTAKKQTVVNTTLSKNRKTKNRSKKRKSNLSNKQDGFEIIEPEFTKRSAKQLFTPVDSEENISDSEVSIELLREATMATKKLSYDDLDKALSAGETDDDIIDIKDEDILKMPLELNDQFASSEIEKSGGLQNVVLEGGDFQDLDFFNNRTNIAALERDLLENLRLFDDEIDLKSPIINPLYDFPITSAVQKWLQTKQNESFDSLFTLQNFKKLTELNEDDDDEDSTSDISDFPKSDSLTDSDYSSDFHTKTNRSSPTAHRISTHVRSPSEKLHKCNKLVAKDSFCALM